MSATSATRIASSATSQPQWTALAAALIVAAGISAYFNSFDGVFVFDDIDSIRENRYIRSLWPLSHAMSLPLIEASETVSRRPLLSLSFAVNYALLGREPWGFHLVNLAIHLTAALLLFGIVRRTLCLAALPERYAEKSIGLAWAVALIWVVHPLQTESVTYIAQRAESLAGMLYLLTMYCSVRSLNSGRPRLWCVAAGFACVAGMGVKEIMATAPLLVVLYDGVFAFPSFRLAWQQRWRFYAGLAATWLVLAVILFAGFEGANENFTNRSPLGYAMTQPGVILYYVRLAVWPDPLMLDYNWPTAETALAVVPAGCVVLSLLAACFWGLYRRRWFGFVGAWFFFTLAPTSSFAALNQNLTEHRMYLALAALVVLVVGGGDRLLEIIFGRSLQPPSSTAATPRSRRYPQIAGAALVLVVAVALTATTISRNFDYHSDYVLWKDNVANASRSYVARHGLAVALESQGKIDQAANSYRRSIEIFPKNIAAMNDLGRMLVDHGKFSEGSQYLRSALEINPRFAPAHLSLGFALAKQQDYGRAIEHYREALTIDPADGNVHFHLGNALFDIGAADEAFEHYNQAVQLDPNHARGNFALGSMLAMQGKLRPAVDHLRRAVKLDPQFAEAHYNLANALSATGNTDEAIIHYHQAVGINSNYAQAHFKLGMLYLQKYQRARAVEHLEKAVELQPASQDAQEMLKRAIGGGGL